MSGDDLKEHFDDVLARREELARRAEEIYERFADNVNRDTVVAAAGWTLVSTGIAFGVAQWLRGRRGILGVLVPLLFMAGGAAILTGGFASRRGARMAQAEEDIRNSLAALDPVARVQVLGHVGRDAW